VKAVGVALVRSRRSSLAPVMARGNDPEMLLPFRTAPAPVVALDRTPSTSATVGRLM